MNYLSHVLSYKYSILNPDPNVTIDTYDWDKHQFSCLTGNWCFSRLYGSLYSDEDKKVLVSIFLHDGWDFIGKNKNHLYCFNEEDSILWLEEVRKITNFEYKIMQIDFNKYEMRLVFDLSKVEIKFATSLIRALFEYPQFDYLKEALAIKKAGLYEDVSLLNLYHMMFMFGLLSTDGHNIVPRMQCIIELPSCEEMKKRLKRNVLIEGMIKSTRSYTFFNLKFEIFENISKEIRDFHQKIDTLESFHEYYKHENSIERHEKFYKKYIEDALKIIKNNNE